MAELITIELSDIYVPERLREVDVPHAMIIADSIQRVGLINPISVRHTPAVKGNAKYALIAGAHRLEAARLSGLAAIDCIKFQSDAQQARILEIEENLKRNDLCALDRAIFVTEYRRIWEAENGAIQRGNPNLSNSANTAELEKDSALGSFMKSAMDRTGLSERSVRAYQRVGLNLDPNLRKKLNGTADADNLSLLTKLVDMGPEKQAGVVRALGAPDTDLKAAIAAASPEKPTLSDRDKIKSRLLDSWHRAHPKDREWFLNEIGASADVSKALASKKGEVK